MLIINHNCPQNSSCTANYLSSYLHYLYSSKMNKTCWVLMENQCQIYKWHSPMDYYTRIHQCWQTRKDLYSSSLDAKWYAKRCPWCSRYRRRKWTRRHEFKSWMRLIAFHIALIPLGKVWIQLFSLQLWVNSRTDWILQPWWGN